MELVARRKPSSCCTDVLVIEDDHVLREALAAMLHRSGCSVSTSGSLAYGMKLLEESPPRFLILDLTLQDGFGTSALRFVKSMGLPTKVAVTTGSASRELMEAALRLGPDKVFRKPYSAAELVGWVRGSDRRED